MIILSNNVKNELAKPRTRSFFLVQLGTYKLTTHFMDVTLSDSRVFLSNGILVAVDSPQLTTAVDDAIFKLVLADPFLDFGAIAEDGAVGMSAEVRIGFVNSDTDTVFTALADTILIYKGRVSSTAYQLKTDELGEALFAIDCASPMADLDFVNTYSTSKSFIQEIAPDDTAYDQLYEGSSQVNIRWGKK